MSSPFPGIDPYLENPELWSAVHNRLIVAIADDLVDRLSEKYRVEIEKRTYFSTDEESVLVGIPDVSVVTKRINQSNSSTATLLLPVQPEEVTIPMPQEVNERYLEIREIGTGSVVTTIELLSPKNKRKGEGRNAYLNKRNQVLASASNLVEIDFLRGGKPLPIKSTNLGDYRILVSRSDRRPNADLYAFSLRQPIPAIPIPLSATETEPILDLQPLFNYVYRKGRYHLAIDYTQPPKPPLSPEDRAWATTLNYPTN
ncbi:MAG: DUF4058 family protein [Oscillatoria sp. PMC 1068.18]|nr:DUF4058 family protein [Oscillatoria sp. PMC 1076.18]MEC4988622.1 DUF4058 family protein [Oscillatoria sp. PMC 1068.18]